MVSLNFLVAVDVIETLIKVRAESMRELRSPGVHHRRVAATGGRRLSQVPRCVAARDPGRVVRLVVFSSLGGHDIEKRFEATSFENLAPALPAALRKQTQRGRRTLAALSLVGPAGKQQLQQDLVLMQVLIYTTWQIK